MSDSIKQTIKIGDLELDYFETLPSDWSMENDCFKSVEMLEPDLYRGTSWMGRTAYIIVGQHDKAIMLSIGQAMKISRLIAVDAQTR